MDRKILLDTIVPLQRVDNLLMRGRSPRDNPMDHYIDFAVLSLCPSHRLRLTLTAEPIVVDFLSPEDRALDAARENLVDELGDPCSSPSHRASAIERLISARVGRALAIHCDADHLDE